MLSFLAARLGQQGTEDPEPNAVVPGPAAPVSAKGPVLLGSGPVGKKPPALLPAAALRRVRVDDGTPAEDKEKKGLTLLPAAAMRRVQVDDGKEDSSAKVPVLPIPSLQSSSVSTAPSTAASTPATGPLIPRLKSSTCVADPPVAFPLPSETSWKMLLEHDEEAQQLQNVYEVEDAVRGKGCYGTVRLARLVAAPTVVRAVKTVSKRTLKVESIVRREINVLRSLDHPCICRLHETFEDDRSIYLVMEFIDGRELFDEIVERGQLDEDSAARVMQQVFGALKYCHERKIIHRDLKPENIMVKKRSTPRLTDAGAKDDLEVKLIDFGLAVLSAASVRSRPGSSVVGSADYMAPEARQGRSGAAADLWSCGVILHLLLVGHHPELEVHRGEELLDVGQPEYAALSAPARELLLGLLQPDPRLRVTAAAAATHAWTGGGGGGTPHDLTRTMRALTSFHRSVKLRRAALTALAMQLTGRQLEVLREQFMAIDTDGNGRISREELARSLAELAPAQGAEEVQGWAESIFDAVDTNGSNEIEYTEWLSAAQLESLQRTEEDAWAAFRVFDADGDGQINEEEFARVLAQSPEEIAGLLPEIDTNGDGVIDFDEFKRLLNVGKAESVH